MCPIKRITCIEYFSYCSYVYSGSTRYCVVLSSIYGVSTVSKWNPQFLTWHIQNPYGMFLLPIVWFQRFILEAPYCLNLRRPIPWPYKLPRPLHHFHVTEIGNSQFRRKYPRSTFNQQWKGERASCLSETVHRNRLKHIFSQVAWRIDKNSRICIHSLATSHSNTI